MENWAVKIQTKNLLIMGANEIHFFFSGCEERKCLEIPRSKIANSNACLVSEFKKLIATGARFSSAGRQSFR